MAAAASQRIHSLDLLKGLVMVVMALDHIRDYFHVAAFVHSPTDPITTTWAIYLTRWITHYCAPAFSFLAGIAACLTGRKKTKRALSAFLLKRGLWLIFIELTIVNFAWHFDPAFGGFNLMVIWALGVSMIYLAGMLHAPRTLNLILSLLIICGHNLLDGLHFPNSIGWSVLHVFGHFTVAGFSLTILYPIVPWIGVMSLGYWFGGLYAPEYAAERRQKLLLVTGVAAIVLFFLIRYINVYGDPKPYQHYNTALQTLMSFMNPTKYPPSLLYLLMTLGPAMLFLAVSEKTGGPLADFFSTFGRVPLFYYILHIYLVHLLAMGLAQYQGFGWQAMILSGGFTSIGALKGYGLSLIGVYAVWALVIALLYPLCRWFDAYKTANKQRWWLSYL